jgi:hypothetical protein
MDRITAFRFASPVSLRIGKRYFLRLSLPRAGIPVFTQVTLVAFTSCPAVVIVQDDRRQQQRCNRADLFGCGKR